MPLVIQSPIVSNLVPQRQKLLLYRNLLSCIKNTISHNIINTLFLLVSALLSVVSKSLGLDGNGFQQLGQRKVVSIPRVAVRVRRLDGSVLQLGVFRDVKPRWSDTIAAVGLGIILTIIQHLRHSKEG